MPNTVLPRHLLSETLFPDIRLADEVQQWVDDHQITFELIKTNMISEFKATLDFINGIKPIVPRYVVGTIDSRFYEGYVEIVIDEVGDAALFRLRWC